MELEDENFLEIVSESANATIGSIKDIFGSLNLDEYTISFDSESETLSRSLDSRQSNSNTSKTVETSPGASTIRRYSADDMKKWRWDDRRIKEIDQSDIKEQLSLLPTSTKQLILKNVNEENVIDSLNDIFGSLNFDDPESKTLSSGFGPRRSNYTSKTVENADASTSWKYSVDDMKKLKWEDKRMNETNQSHINKLLQVSARTKQLVLRSETEDQTWEPASPIHYRSKYFNDNENSYRKAVSMKRSITISLHEVIELETEVPEQVILKLLEKLEGFKRIIGSSLSFEDVVLLLRVFDKICSSHFDENRGRLITIIVNENFLDKILEYLLLLAAQTSKDKTKNMFFWENPEKFWSNLLILYENIFEFMPATAREVLPKIVKATIISINDAVKYQEIVLSTDVKEKIENFDETLTSTEEQIQAENNVEVEEPPNNFRLMNIYPTVQEITTREVPFIRPIIKNGAYQSVEHYLDVQFRLLKEDFTASLRNGICTYLERDHNEQPKQQYDVRIYEKVQFIAPHITRDKVASLLQYTTKIDRKSIEESSKRFIFGSLVCFTSDNFEEISSGTVVDNDKKLLRKGQIIVDIREGHIDFNKNYTMVECTVFFEPYFQVLTALKKIHKDNFPFKDYIIDVTSETKPPKYITQRTVAYFKTDHYKFKILSPETWPRPEQVGLNESQFKAFQSALSQEFCIIQGPPGTGKTYTTLRIVEFLLRNKFELKYRGPIFVICFTNHALDQFLEGVLPFTDYLLRVGGQSKSPVMKQYSLKKYREIIRKIVLINRRKKTRKRQISFFCDYSLECLDEEYENDPDLKKYDFSDYYHRPNISAAEYFTNVKEVKVYQNLLSAVLSFDGIIDFETSGKIYRHSWFSINSKAEIIEWLMENDNQIYFDTEDNEEKSEEEQSEIEEDAFEMYQQNERKLEDDIENMEEDESKTFHYCVTPKNYQNLINEYENKINELDTDKYDEMHLKYEEEIQKLRKKMHYLTWRLRQCKTQEEVIVPDVHVHPQEMNSDDRWNFYRHWLGLLQAKLYKKISAMDFDLRSSYRAYQEVAQLRDIYIMQKMKVIGMTTTGAARHKKLLQTLQCPIVIAEEAAEVLESHIVVSLTEHCQHLILIGDHKQLRPNTAEYNLAIKYNLEISLFERMVQNGIHCQQLNIQHRMRPEIAKLINPAIYAKLDNSPSVEIFPCVLGVTKNLFFIDHCIYEDYMHNNSSHKNVYEAKYMMRLASYFIKQGYTPEAITILTTYKGQMYLLMEERRNHKDLDRVRITVVDNFQGEENKIILLSLVRSNREANIGFLKIENRVCVALSRAKEGFFIIGNMSNLEKSSSIWPKVKEALVDQNAIGDTLTLQCQMHCKKTDIRSWEDFKHVPEGGCNAPCNTRLKCDHICKLPCHPYDKLHEEYACQELCTKTCPRGHSHQELCYKKLLPCDILIKTRLSCGHTQSIPCSVEEEEYLCKATLEAVLPCGHTGNKKCHQDPLLVKCLYRCEKQLNCGHVCQSLCHLRNDPDHLKYTCMEACTKFKKGCSTNEHICPQKCFEKCLPCDDFIQKRRTTCTHKVRVPCNQEIGDLVCREKCRKILLCGHHCPKLCFQECGDCSVMVKRTIEACGHTVTTKCSNVVDMADMATISCDNPCSKQLCCGHVCNNKCNEPCTEKCKTIIMYTDSFTGKMVRTFCYRNQTSNKLQSDSDDSDTDVYW